MTRGQFSAMDKIKAIVLDVDGVLTDGGFWWGPNGEEWKRFSFADVMGVSLATKAGLIVALISGEDSPLTDRYARKMGIIDVEKNCKDKARAVRAFSERRGVSLSEICFMGDDVNDSGAMEIAGFSAAPADANPLALQKARLVTSRTAGNGAVRELVDTILAARANRPNQQTP
jgi:3-deoxy-D-manno-octulosonate 8-phosphate phosphatase (KDO 8-P phosphatase)